MIRGLVAAPLAAFLCTAAQPARAQAYEPYLGQIMIFAGGFCPTGWAATDGSLLPVNSNSAIFSLLGFNYGGNGTSTFALPHLQPIYTQTRFPLTTCIATVGVFPPRN